MGSLFFFGRGLVWGKNASYGGLKADVKTFHKKRVL